MAELDELDGTGRLGIADRGVTTGFLSCREGVTILPAARRPLPGSRLIPAGMVEGEERRLENVSLVENRRVWVGWLVHERLILTVDNSSQGQPSKRPAKGVK